jgi:hypothetical protein
VVNCWCLENTVNLFEYNRIDCIFAKHVVSMTNISYAACVAEATVQLILLLCRPCFVLHRLYEALNARDAAAIRACLTADVAYENLAIQDSLAGQEVSTKLVRKG